MPRILGISIYMTVKQEDKTDTVERKSGVSPIVLPREYLNIRTRVCGVFLSSPGWIAEVDFN